MKNRSLVVFALLALFLTGVASGQDTTGTASNKLETVATFDGPMPTGVTVSSSGRIFVCYPRWGDNVTYTVAEVKNGEPSAYPDQDFNTTHTGARQAEGFVSVQSVVVDPLNRLWALDTGSIKFGPTSPGGPKLVGFDLASDKITTRILIPPDVALTTTYLNDVRFDLTRGAEGMAFITDSSATGPGAIIVVDLATGKAWRALSGHESTQAEPGFVPTVEGKPLLKKPTPTSMAEPPKIAADGIAISADGERLYYCSLITRKLYSVSTDALEAAADGKDAADAVKEETPRSGAADGMESDAAGNLYFTDYENAAIVQRSKDGKDSVLAKTQPMEWPDTLSVAQDGFIYLMANQLHRQSDYHEGKDMRQKPYRLYRMRIDTEPVSLK